MNTQINPIVVPIDFSTYSINALHQGYFMARLMRTDLVLVHVIPSMLSFGESSTLSFSNPEHRTIYSEITDRLDELVNQEDIMGGVEVSYQISRGNVAKEVIKVADSIDASFIIMGTRGGDANDQVDIGTNAYQVSSGANCPVITYRSNIKQRGFKSILLPIDTTIYSRQKVKTATFMAYLFDAKIHILGISSEIGSEIEHKLTILCKQVYEYISEYNIARSVTIATGKKITDFILEMAQKVEADVICITTEKEPGIEDIFMGETAQRLVRKSQVPILSIKPIPISEIYEFGT